jgi:hypothetical protein
MLEVRGLTLSRGGKYLLEDASFVIGRIAARAGGKGVRACAHANGAWRINSRLWASCHESRACAGQDEMRVFNHRAPCHQRSGGRRDDGATLGRVALWFCI